MKSYRSYLFSVGLLILTCAAFGLSGCKNQSANANAPAPPPPTVTVSTPLVKDVVHYAEFTGTTEAVESVVIRARVEGYLEKIHFTEGAMVEKGQLLFTIDDKPYQAKLEEALADLAMQQAELEQTRATKIRKENALRDNAVSEVEVIDARAELGKAQARVKAAKAAIRTAKLDISYTRVKSPISGRIGRRMVDVGNLVGAGERTELAGIVKDDPIYAYFTISERSWIRYQAKRSPDDPKTIYMGLSNSKDFPFEGRIDFIDNRMDAATGTIKVRGIFPNPQQRILPGLFARVRIPIGATTGALLVPDSALGQDQQGHYLLVANPENITEYRPVATGEIVDGMRVIASGLKGDERVIVNGLQKARPGAPTTPVPAVPDGASPKDAPPSATAPKA
ncbi:MAG: efflux RND transporter periplasmic adaptor subunit [Desulfobacterales bacterium]|nr:efflux RND transporter periplasmic adaptor subunit [Desulfobacterales bacterium]